MLKQLLPCFILLLIIVPVIAQNTTCTHTLDLPRISQNTRLCTDTYDHKGISIVADNVVFDCGFGVLRGRFQGTGIEIINRKNVTIINCHITQYNAGILVQNSSDITIMQTNLMRNNIGVKLLDSAGIVMEKNTDISLNKPVHVINSLGNVISYVNKRINADTCKVNQCSPSGIAAHYQLLAKKEESKSSLRRLLNDQIRAWLA